MARAFVVLILCLSLCFAGCASIIHGNTELIGFTSEPPGAKLTVAGTTTVTPAHVLLARRGKHVANFSMPGYETTHVPLREGISLWWLFGNLGFGVIGAPVGWIVDGVNGSLGDLSPDNVHVDLVPLSGSSTP